LRVLLALIALFGLLLVVRLYFVQVVHGADYALRAQHQYVSASQSLYDRGSIYFTKADGSLVSAATLATGFLVTINPEQIRDPEAAYSALSKFITIDHDSFIAQASKPDDPYEEVQHHVDEAAGEAIAAADIPGVQVLRERWRTYPGDELASHEIGFVAHDSNSGDAIIGQYGLERQYDATLERSDSDYRNFFAELFANLGDLFVDAQSAREGDVVTTIEPEVETRLMNDIQQVQTQYASKTTGGIIMDPKTGAIIAIGSVPTYDPNDLAHADPSTFPDPMVEHVYEFGSIVKSLTMASGLDAGVIQPDTTYDDTGCIKVNGATICNYDLRARGVIPMQQILSQSLNVGASWIATQLGQARQRQYFTALFGSKTGVDLPNESNSLLANLSTTEQVNYDTASFGQGIAVTPVQMIRAVGALANGGALVRPHLVSAIKLDSGITKTLDWSGTTQVFSPQAVAETAKMLTAVGDYALGNGADRMDTMGFAVKTGTAQLEKPGGGYYKDRYFHSFYGFFPSDPGSTPRFIILLYTYDPQGVEYASNDLTGPYLDLMHFLINYYQIPPSRTAVPPPPAS
jgi:cell division protein FtsI (penicillin-binding protein 3)/stage V sporulation protein D (sporulation-specific penicillin-binding protein)